MEMTSKRSKLKWNVEPQPRSRTVSGRFATKSFCYKSFSYIMMSACGEVVKFSARNVYSGEELGKTDVFAGYVIGL